MDCSIVYLKPKGAGGFKTELRSDSLWAALCWAIRTIFSESDLEELINAYAKGDHSKAFFISSAFPYIEEDEDKVCFFPTPLLPFRFSKRINIKDLTPAEIKLEARRRKKQEKYPPYLSQSHFEYLIAGHLDLLGIKPAPEIINRPMTHNTINRLKGSTLELNESGQLFHTEEFFLKEETSGLFFLLKGNLEKIIPALRFLEYEGIGGDRSTGKGRFQISEPENFTLNTPEDANSKINLSLYHPIADELNEWPGEQERLLNYKLEDRLGRTHLQKQYLHDRALLFFKEGSVFPSSGKHSTVYGQNVVTGKHSADFDIFRYGYGFMVDAKIL